MSNQAGYSEDWTRDADPEHFWSLVDLAYRDPTGFLARLQREDRRGLIRFAWLFEDFASRLADEPYVDTADPELSEDRIDDLCESVVGRGRTFYEQVLADPGLMPLELRRGDPARHARRTVFDIYHERYGGEIPPYSYDY